MAAQTPQPLDPAVEAEIQRRFNELENKRLDVRAAWINRWLSAIGIILTFFTIVIPIAGYISFENIKGNLKEEAQKRVDEVNEHLKKAKKLVNNIEKDQKKAENIVGQLAKILSPQEQGEKVKVIEGWRAIAKTVEGSDNNLAARAWFSVGYLHYQQKKYKEAIEALSEANRIRPDGSANVFVIRGSAKAALHDYKAAIKDYNKAISLNPKNAAAYNNRGLAKIKMRRYEDAVKDYDEAIRLNPKQAETFSNRGKARIMLKQFEDAIADYDKAFDLSPRSFKDYSNRGLAKYFLDQNEAAIKDYDKAIGLNPKDVSVYINRGNAKSALDQKDEARDDFTTALKLAREAGNKDLAASVEQMLKKLNEE